MRIVSSLFAGAVTLVALIAGACDACAPEKPPVCTYKGDDYSVGATWTADDGCNQCVCGEDIIIRCTDVVCSVDGGSGDDGGAGQDGGPDADGGGDAGPITNEVVPFPSEACEVVSVNGAPPSGIIAPFNQVQLSAAQLPAPTPGASVTALVWSVARAPSGSRAGLSLDGQIAPSVVGTYVAQVDLTDDQAGQATHLCRFDVYPPDAIYVELTWDYGDPDMDIRLIKKDAQGRYCSADQVPAGSQAQSCADATGAEECYFGNCKQRGSVPDWDGDGASGSVGDPWLSVDDLYGYGPEAILIEEAPVGDYLLVVHYWSDHGVTGACNARARVYAHGQLRAELTAPLVNGDWWEPVELQWLTQTATDLCVVTPGGGDQYCAAAPQCDPAPGCAQCTDSAACGPGTACDVGLGLCTSAAAPCLNDSACETPRICIPATDACNQPECGVAGGCEDPRQSCSADLLSCVMPPAICDEPNEPNDTIAQATLVSGTEHQDLLCRGDVDVLEVAGHADTRLWISIDFGASGVADGIRGELLDASGAVIDEDQIYYDGQLSLSTSVVTDAAFFVALQGSAESQDEYTYTLTLQELEPLLCLSEPGEPNDELVAAAGSPLTEGGYTRSLCGETDVDYHQIVATALLRTVVTVDFLDTEGDIELELLRADGTSLMSSNSPGDREQVRYTASAEDETLVVRVGRQVYGGFEEEQGYLITVAHEAAPDCGGDGNEPNDSEQSATPISPGSVNGMICDALDHDFFAVTLTQQGDLAASASFIDADGDLELRLTSAGGAHIDSSSTTQDTESVSGLGLAPGTYYLEVYNFSGSSPAPEAQPYSLTVSVTGNADAGVEDAAADAALPDGGAGDGGVEDGGSEDAASEDAASEDAAS